MTSGDYLERIAREWHDRSTELAHWTLARLVNRTDVWGRYLPLRNRKKAADGSLNNAITAPFRDERGKVFLGISSLEKHFRARQAGGVLGVHSSAADGSCRWLAIDIDLHDEDDLSVSREGNFVAAKGWYEKLNSLGMDPVLLDSNGRGGFHLWLLFDEPMNGSLVRKFAEQLVADFSVRGLDSQPEIFPGKRVQHHYGSWLRLPGRHHTRNHFSRVWNDEPWADEQWLEGHDAIDRLIRTRPAAPQQLEALGIQVLRKTVCLDFDGVIHSYRSGWQGPGVIPDPPIHRTKEAIARIRKRYRVVVHSARCADEAGLQAIENWLAKHEIEVDEVCRFKPPAFVYVDDRAIHFGGDWDQTIAAINDFRK